MATGRSVYHAPGEQRMSLLYELSRRPSTASASPEEDQLTIVLGWLCDHSTRVARAVVEAFVADDSEALAALASAKQLGAKVQVRLPPLPTTGPLWADLSITTEDRGLQLLVESKLDSHFHSYSTRPRRLFRRPPTALQPDAYLGAWRTLDSGEARVRRLGTLRAHGSAPVREDPWRAKDLTWRDVYDVVRVLIDDSTSPVPASVASLADEFVQHLDARVLEPCVSEEALEEGKALVDAALAEVLKSFPGATANGSRINPKAKYGGGAVLRIPHARHNLEFWVAVTPRATPYNVPGWDDVLQIQNYSASADPVRDAALLAVGFEDRRDRRYPALRAKVALADLDSPNGPGFPGDAGADWVVGLLRQVLDALDALSSA